MNPSAFIVVAFLCADNETEALCNVGILLFLLNHQASLPPQGEHGGKEGELLHVGVDVVEPELVHRQEGPGSSYAGAAVHQNRACFLVWLSVDLLQGVCLMDHIQKHPG